jgi:tryptophanyl-tRNA synthetase
MLSAVQTTNVPTLGNYLGALKNWADSYRAYDSLFFAVDLHAITLRQNPRELREATYAAIASYVAAGIDPAECTLFVQSHVSQHAELAWVLTCHSALGELQRMTQFKDKSAREGVSIPAGLLMYPVLMAADILLYQTELVPVGEDQKQHIELTRDLALRLNHSYGEDLFSVPEPSIPRVGARIMSLQNPTAKMSKSDPDPNGCVFLTDTDDQIAKKIRRAVTDSGNEISWDESKPGIRNLLSIQAAISGKEPEALVEQYRGKQYGHLKVETADCVVAALRPVRERMVALLSDKAELDRILARGAEKARQRAAVTLSRVYERLGMISAAR